ncbi:hypothetical protein PHMEG_00031824 [Phytophthora megakarya]|uniref:HTH CENPB-type domain-containing protein n=1 Tax=Phytophthora megakarya TaxID=4795 RepID=A0A225UX59_9STRA|nr:hypothetical protein PHMEG_00031824 [Phytophthora megakarya]
MDATVKKYYPELLSHAERKSKKRQIYKWIQKKEAILSAVGSGHGHLHKIRAEGLGTVLSDEDEDIIAHWLRDLLRDGVPVTSFMLASKAKEVAQEAGLPHGSFLASNTWQKRFLSKYQLSSRHETRPCVPPSKRARLADTQTVKESETQELAMEDLVTAQQALPELVNRQQTFAARPSEVRVIELEKMNEARLREEEEKTKQRGLELQIEIQRTKRRQLELEFEREERRKDREEQAKLIASLVERLKSKDS